MPKHAPVTDAVSAIAFTSTTHRQHHHPVSDCLRMTLQSTAPAASVQVQLTPAFLSVSLTHGWGGEWLGVFALEMKGGIGEVGSQQ